VAFILKTFPEMELAEQVPRLGAPGLASSSLSPAERELVQRFDPTFDPTVTGFFIAKFIKRRSAADQ
jgi:16S rRNA C967 or C1407 C5-methylase (RsmB/RsmF family)